MNNTNGISSNELYMHFARKFFETLLFWISPIMWPYFWVMRFLFGLCNHSTLKRLLRMSSNPKIFFSE